MTPPSPLFTVTASILALSALLSFTPPASFALSPQQLFKAAEGKVLVLEVTDDRGKRSSDHTALLLDGEKAVTRCDLLTGAAGLMLRDGKSAYPAKPLQRDPARNLCLLRVAAPTSGVKLRDTEPAVGSRVFAVSNALGMGVSISEGVVSGIREPGGDTAIQFTAPIAPGSEGGGLFDEDGRLVGVISYELRDGQNVNFAQPARWIREIESRATAADAVESWRARSDLLAKEGRWRDLKELAVTWREALPDSLDARYCLAFAQQQLREWSAAEVSYRELVTRDPMSVRPGVGLATVLFEQKKYQEALEAITAAQNYHQENALLWLLTAYTEEALGNSAKAASALEKAVLLEPWNQDALRALVDLSRAHGEWGKAIAAQSRLVEFDPGDVTTRLNLANLLLLGGRPAKALTTVARALEVSPTNGDAWVLKGIALVGLGRFRDAVAAYRKGVELKPTHPARVWKLLGDVYYGLRLYPEAVAAYRDSLLLAPDDTESRGQMGLALKDGLRLQDALELFEKLREKSPDAPFPWRQVGYVHSYLAQADKAIPAYEQSLVLDANQPKVWAALMEAYHTAGRMADAQRAYGKLKALDQTWADSAYKRVLLPYGVAP